MDKDLKCKKRSLEAHIVDDHNEALKYILQKIGSKSLQFSDNILLHFDSHPDLCTDVVNAADVYDKNILLNKVRIETWIIPLLYAGHFKTVIWIKPFWSTQIHAHDSIIYVGENKETGQLRIFSELPYFIGSAVCSPLQQLKNVKKVSLYVTSLQAGVSNSDKIVSLIKENNNEFVLDIDLDYYSTKNPFLHIYDKVNTYERLKDIFKYDLRGIVNVEEAINSREKQLKSLESIFEQINKSNNISQFLNVILDDSSLDNDVLERLKCLVTDINKCYDNVDWILVYEAGTTIDDLDNELPHHISTMEEIDTYLDQTKTFLDELPTPKLITVARSTSDDYCPQHQVDYIQKMLTKILQQRFNAKIYTDYMSEVDH